MIFNWVQQIKDEPDRFSKKADMLESAGKLMQTDLEAINEEIGKKNKVRKNSC